MYYLIAFYQRIVELWFHAKNFPNAPRKWPLLEYASEVWDGSTQADANRLEQVQLNAARIVTGLPVFASLDSLYHETVY